MSKIGIAVVLALVTASGLTAAPAQAQTEDMTAHSRALAGEFQDRLRGQLMGALNSGGPLQALDVCQKAAPAIAQEIGTREGATIWRTSLRNRSPRGTPDARERATLEQFDARRTAGEDPATIEASTQTASGFRFMKAIPMGAPCAQCHGVSVAPDVAAKIAALYPQDRATGYKPGELRGAVSVTWPAVR